MTDIGNCKIEQRRHGKHGTYLNLYPKSGYDPTVYERPVLTVDVCIFRNDPFTGKAQILLIKRGQAPFKNRWAFPGGYVNIEDKESADAAALRELHEETGIHKDLVSGLKQFRTYSSADRDPRWYTTDVVYRYVLTQIEAGCVDLKAGDDAKQAKWHNIDVARKLKLAFDHNIILEDMLLGFGWLL